MLATLTKAHVRPLIDLNDQVNQLTSRESEINSTRIVVQGDQSHGKSSLLEALSGVDLPRGDDIKTRVPLIMQLRSCEDADQEHAFISRKGAEPERIALSEVAAKVDEFTEAIAGGSKGVKDEPIELKVFRRDQDDLTLIDLPGITRVGREGQGDGKQLEALILGMCKRYSAPPESVILNVVSAMVDFSTSASLQLSQELDPEGRRTLLCVTKIDQHKEPGLAKKIDVSIESMCIRPEHVFVVRNRKQEENDAHLPLSRARELETECICSNLELERGAEATGYGLGVSALSEQLVRIQLERIIETLPATAKAIRARLSQLEQRVAQIGPPLEGELACRLLAAKLVDEIREQLEKEREGRVSRAAGLQTAEGEVFDIKLEVDDWVACCSSNKAKGSFVASEPFELPGGIFCTLHIYPNGCETSTSGFCGAVLMCDMPEKTKVGLEFSLAVYQGGTVKKRLECIHDFSQPGQGWGFENFITSAQYKGALSFYASVYVSSVDVDDKRTLFCAALNKLDEQLRDNIDKAHPARMFFSKEFGRKLEMAANSRRGSCGMPDSINQEVPLGVLHDLRKKLPSIVEQHVTVASTVASTKLQSIIDAAVEFKAHPRLVRLMQTTAAGLVEQLTISARRESERLMQYEDAEAHTSNHYYMDIVQQLRKDILADNEAETVWSKKPAFLDGLDFSSLKTKSNAEQEIVDLQIKTFAYWKVMKKRLVDYLQLVTRYNLSAQLIEQLKPALMRAIAGEGDLATLMAPDESLARERSSLSKRIADLKKADALIEQAGNDRMSMQSDLAEPEGKRMKASS